ncbi:putative transcription factor WD40-like family [Rosa chinensis]|uniref:Putative transcription factor WD40-like family n=2 Tax=Rosa chinensis TaxID=74649 RepID=A0A2P6PUF7_ROSCH|nr:uncharacterized protein LOC112170492 isoform X1 [Rosa chinensis]PRQ25561.1 putative transcription factor WD40-like family [Rosa chinensis]
MALRYRRFREISRLLPQIHSGDCYIQCRSATKLAALSIIPHVYAWERNGTRMPQSRFSTTSEISYNSTQELDLLSFIKSSLDEREGPCHCWLNRSKGNRDFLGRDGTFLVLAGWCETFLTTCESVVMLEKVKSLQHRYPQLHVMGFLSGSSVSLAAARSHLIQYVVKENVTFPVILSNRTFPEMDNGACYILFKDFESPVFYHEKDLDLRILNKAVEEFHVQDDGRARSRDNLKSTWVKQFEIIKEPYVYAVRNLLFNFPGCVSADESGNRLFLSDSSHHRIIVFDGNGNILDCIGSSPGFEDGNFESAKMVRPASSIYDAAEDSLYFVDSENHAIRKADLGKRVLETLYPNYDASKKSNSIWTRIMIKLGLRSNDKRSEEFDIQALMFPWHLMKSSEDSFFIINRSFETLWILNLASGEIEQVVKGFPKILDVCGPQIMEKVSLLKQMPHDWLQQQTNAVCSPKRLPYASLISSLTTLQNHVILCDMVGQQILKLSEESGVCSAFQFSNFGILGLPYWLASSLERVYAAVGGHQKEIDHQECFSLLPGRIGIQLNVEIPVGTELVEQLQEGCIWRQARGAATEVLGAEDAGGSSEKVGAAQQWYDELDNLAFSLSTPESELNVEDDCTTSDIGFQDERVHIDCAVNTSPGTSEVIVYAALYLKLRKHELLEDDQEKCAARIAAILNSDRSGKMGRDSFIQFLLNSNRDLRDLIFMKPLHVRVKLDCLDHPKAANGKDIILTDSNIEVNVVLSS